jgi:hypothetical protein
MTVATTTARLFVVALVLCAHAAALAAAPLATTSSASAVTSSSALLNGSGTPNGEASTGFFRLSTTSAASCDGTFGTRVPSTGGTALGGGSNAVTYSITTTGLFGGTTYFFCAGVTNASGTRFGSVQSFSTPGAPVVTTQAASAITNSGATLAGSANPTSSATTGFFRFSTTSPGACSDLFGTRSPVSGGTSLGAGTAPVAYTTTLTGLLPGTRYFYCALASNAVGTSVGAIASFTTLPARPTLTSALATNVASRGATLNGSVNPGGGETTAYFRIAAADPGTCNDVFGTRAPVTGGTIAPASTSTSTFSEAVTGLLPATTYFYCAVGTNSAGTAFGSVLSFTTAAAPTVATQAPANVTNVSATLNGSANPNRAATVGYFRLSTTNPGTCDDAFGTRTPVSGGTALGNGSSSASFSQGVTGLLAGTTYFFCALAENSEGRGFGQLLSFTTPTSPAVTTQAVTALSSTAATLNGTANPNGASTTGHFRFSTTNPGECNDSFGTRTPASGGTNVGSRNAPVAYTASLTGLLPATTYFFCALANNAFGTTTGSIEQFVTPPARPALTTSAATALTSTTATLNGLVNPGGVETSVHFRFGTANPGQCNDTFGVRAPSLGGTTIPAGLATTPVALLVTGLLPSTTYFFCMLADNVAGDATGSVLSFTTPAPPTATTLPPTGLLNTSVTLNGSANPNRALTTGYFRFATVDPGTCNDTFGTRAPATGGASLGSGATAVTFTQPITGLVGGTTYFFCALAENAEGRGVGAVSTFRTPTLPSVTTTAATAVSASTATLNGAGTPNGGATTGFFRFSTTNPGTCNDTFGTRAPTTGGATLGAGNSAVAYSTTVAALPPATTIFFCALATNQFGTATGPVQSFTTPPAAPSVTTTAPTLLTSSSATLNASITPNGAETSTWFRFAAVSPGACNDAFGTRVPAVGEIPIGQGLTAVPYGEPVAGLLPSTTYFACALARNTVGTTVGNLVTFTTPAGPTVTSLAPTELTNVSVTLNGSANPNRSATFGHFRLSTTNPGVCNDTFGTRAPDSGGTVLGSGSTATTFAQSVANLQPGTTYFFCAVAENVEGLGFGLVQTFKTPTAPSVTTAAATVVTATSATLNGAASPNGNASTGFFRFSVDSPGACNDNFGTRAPAAAGATLGAGASSVAYSNVVTGLLPATTYFYCAVASNNFGTSSGELRQFTTLATTPTTTTLAATAVTAQTATLHATVNPGGAAAIAWFRFSTSDPGTCNDVFGTRTPGTAGTGTAIPAGVQPVVVDAAIVGLSPSTKYFFCALAENALGPSVGPVLSFTTAAPPTATTLSPSALLDTSAQLNGSANPNRAEAVGFFRLSTTNPLTCNDTFGARVPTTGGVALGAGATAVAFAVPARDLLPGTTYFVCALATSAEGTAAGALVSFTTPTAPQVTTQATLPFTATTATLNGTVNARGADATAFFRFSTTDPGACNDAFGTRAPALGGTAVGAASSTTSFSQGITGLAPATTYFVCAGAANAFGTSFGAVGSFTTAASAPVTTTADATDLTSTTARLNGAAVPGGAATTGRFRFATASPGVCNDTFGTPAPFAGGSSLGAGLSSVAFSEPIAGLLPSTTYFFCAIADNSAGVTLGALKEFTTPARPSVTTNEATSVLNVSATLNGAANPNRSATTGFFRFSRTNPGVCNDTFGTRAPTSGGVNVGSGTTSSSFSVPVTGLPENTTIFFCALASNAEGTSVGSVQSFTTPAAPTVTTATATAVLSQTATLSGAANPNGGVATGFFRFASSNPGVCNDAFGTRAPASAGTALGGGRAAVDFSTSLTGLAPATTYFFCAVATNAFGTSFGELQTFTTDPTAPTVTTTAPSQTTSATATLTGSVVPGGASTTGFFRFSATDPGSCNEFFGTRAPAVGGVSLGAGLVPRSYAVDVSGLTPNTTYYVCAVATNAVGTALGGLTTFTTPALPAVTTEAAANISGAATLRGTINPNGASSTGHFRFSTTNPFNCDDSFGTRAPAVGGVPVGAGRSAVAFSVDVTSLAPSTTYFFCAIAQNSEGTTFGSVQSFTTPLVPLTTTMAATPLAATTATLNALVNPNGFATTVHFRFSVVEPLGCDDTFGGRAPTTDGVVIGAGTEDVTASEEVAGLLPGTTYFFCAIATSPLGSSFGNILSFTTPALSPVTTTLSPDELTRVTARFRALANPNGGETVGWFRFSDVTPAGCDDTFGTRIPATGGVALGDGNAGVAFDQPVVGLQPLTTYFVCSLVQNDVGLTVGNVVAFRTPDAPVATTVPASFITSSSATLSASVVANGAATQVHFRFSTTTTSTQDCDDTFGTRVPESGELDAGTSFAPATVQQSIDGLLPGTAYFFCPIATNAFGTSLGSLTTFRTLASLPIATTSPASLVTATTAQLGGEVDPRGGATEAWFRFSDVDPGTCNDSFGTRTPDTGGVPIGDGVVAVPVARAVSGLRPRTTYFFCTLAANVIGATNGVVRSFTTPDVPDLATTAATVVTATTAELTGAATPNFAPSLAWFRFSTSDPGTCDDNFGTRVPAVGGIDVGDGGSPVAFAQAIAGLERGTTYFYCALAENLVGTGTGPVLSFTTQDRPTVSTQAASDITGGSATLNGAAVPNRASTTGYFRFSTTNPGTCDDTFGTRAPEAGGAPLGAGSSSVDYAAAITGLAPGTTYFFCAFADNVVGSSAGTVRSFTTPSGPTVATLAPTAVTATTVTLRGEAVPNLAATTGFFRFSDTDPGTCTSTFGVRAPTVGGTTLGAGTVAVPYAQSLVGLAPGTTYFVCAFATNAVGTNSGVVVSFKTPEPPSVTTADATNVTATTATLNGIGNPRLAATTGHFRVSTIDPGACDDVFGARAPTTGGTDLGAGDSDVAFSATVTGLLPRTTYFFCAIARNAPGTGTGAVRSFTTPAAPTTTTTGADAVTATTARLSGVANPNLGESTGYFRFSEFRPAACDDTFGTRVPQVGGIPLGAVDGNVAFDVVIEGLAAGTTYFFCARAENVVGATGGAVLSFTTPTLPTATTMPATNVLGVEATLQALVDANRAATAVHFRFDTTNPGVCDDAFGTRAPLNGSTSVPAEGAGVLVREPAIGLSPSTTYFFCVVAENVVGTAFGPVLSFTTPDPPVVTSRAATDVLTSSVTLNGEAVPNRASTTGFFRYDVVDPGRCDDLFGTRVPESGGTSLGAGLDPVAYTEPIADLLPGTTYFFCALAESSEGVVGGEVLSFTTPAAPLVTTTAAIDVRSTTATLGGAVNPRGQTTTAAFRIDTVDPGACDGTFGVRVPSVAGATLQADFIDVPFTQTATDLQPATTYYFCAVADNALGAGFGAVQSFTTTAAPLVTSLPPLTVSSRSATLHAAADPRRASTTAWFRLAPFDPGACDDSFGTRVPDVDGVALGDGAGPVDYTAVAVDLLPGTTWFACAIAANEVGTTFGELVSFKTPSAPTVVTLSSTEVTRTQAVLNATATGNLAETIGWFRIADVDPVVCDDARGVRVPDVGGLPLGSSTTPTPYAVAVDALVPGTRYWVCALAENEAGVSVGAPVSFVAENVPTVTTTPATAVEPRGALLNARVDPVGSATRGWFRYADTDPGACDDVFGTRVPTDGTIDLGDGNGDVDLVAGIAGLVPKKPYWFCALAENEHGVSVGTVATFETAVAVPDVATGDAVALTASTANAAATVTANGAETTAWFYFSAEEPVACDDAFAQVATASEPTVLAPDVTPASVTGLLAGLRGATDYWFCAVAQNEAGTTYGAVGTFTTPPLPTVTTEQPRRVVATAATLRGTVNPEGAATRAWFRYATTEPPACDDVFGVRTSEVDDVDIGDDERARLYDVRVVDLRPATTYWVCAVAQSATGVAVGVPVAFTTPPAPPTVTTLAPSEVTTRTARLTGAATANGAATTAWFRYAPVQPDACDDTFGVRVPDAGHDVGDGHDAVSFEDVLAGLRPGVNYWYCAIAQNEAGLSFGALQTFLTGATAPTVRTRNPLRVDDGGAVLYGVGVPNGLATTGWFRLGDTEPVACSETFGARLPPDGGFDLGNAGAPQPLALAADGLQPRRTYWYCAVAANDGGASFGDVVSFTTETAPPVVKTRSTTIGDDGVTLRAAANPNGAPTTGWFRVATKDPGTCDDDFGTRLPARDVVDVGEGREEAAFALAIGPQEPGRWWGCAIAENEGGISFGDVVSWTIEPPAEPGCASTRASNGAFAGLLAALALVRRRRRSG